MRINLSQEEMILLKESLEIRPVDYEQKTKENLIRVLAEAIEAVELYEITATRLETRQWP